MKSIFFYGLFMDEELLKAKDFHPENVTLALVTGYGLRIGERATLVKSENEQSYGTVIQLNQVELNSLYSDESVADYQPEEITAEILTGNIVPAISYILPLDKLSGQNKAYARSLAIVASKIGLPEEYVREIETWAR